MLTRLKSLFRVPPSVPTRFVPPDQLTKFQRDSWYRAAPIALTEAKMEALVVFFARSLSGRWSLLEAGPVEDGAARYVVLLEAETEAGLLEVFRAVADSPGAAKRLSLG